MGLNGHTLDVEKPLLSVNQVAQLCGVTRRTVYGFLSTGELRSVRVGARLRITQDDLADWINQKTAESRTSA